MRISNKFLRFITSIVVSLLIYLIILLIITQDSNDILEGMIMIFIFGIFLVSPFLVFIASIVYYILSPKTQRPIKKRVIKISGIITFIMILVYSAAQFTDLLD